MYTVRPSKRESGAFETRVADGRPTSFTVMYLAASRSTSTAPGGFNGLGVLRAMIVERVSILPLRIVRSGTVMAAAPLPSPVPPFGFNFGPAENAAGRDTGGSAGKSLPGFKPTTTTFKSGELPAASGGGGEGSTGTAPPGLPL